MSHLLKNLILQPSDPISWISPTKYLTVFFVANFINTKSFGSSGCTMQSLHFRSHLILQIHQFFLEVKSEPDMSEFVLNSFVLTFFVSLGLEGPIGLLLPARSSIRSFSAVRVTVLYIFLQPSTTCTDAGCRHWVWTNVFWIQRLSQRAACCATDEVVKLQLTLLANKSMPISVTILRLLPATAGSHNFKTLSTGSITAVSSVFGKQKVQLVSHFLRNFILQPSDPTYWISPKNISLFSLLLILAVQNRMAQVAGLCSPLHLRSHLPP